MLRSNSRFRSLTVALALVGSLVASAATMANSLSMQSESGDYIGQGLNYNYTDGVTATASSDNRVVSIAVSSSNGDWWYVDIAAPNGQELIPGTYEGAVRYPFQEPYQPGLAVYGNGRGCNQDFGTFTVTKAKFGQYGYIESFEATFEQHCEFTGAPALRGQVVIANPPPPEALVFNLTANSAGTVNKLNGVATVKGTVQCSTQTTAQVYFTLSERVGRKSMAYGSNSASVPCGPTATTWSGNVTSQTGVPFGQGQAQFDVNANAYDPNYGGTQSKSASTVVNLTTTKRNVTTAKGTVLSN